MRRDLPASAAADARFMAWRDWLDSLIEREVLRLRARYELSLDELRGLYVSDAQVDALLRERLGDEVQPDPSAALTARAQALAPSFEAGTALCAIGHRLDLNQAELDLLLLALAPEIDPRYETLYAYLNNDIARRHLTIDLAQRLLADSRAKASRSDARLPASRAQPLRSDAKHLLVGNAPLLASGAIELFDVDEHRSAWSQGVKVAPLIAQFCQGLPLADSRWPAVVRWFAGPSPARPAMAALHAMSSPGEPRPTTAGDAQQRRPLLPTAADNAQPRGPLLPTTAADAQPRRPLPPTAACVEPLLLITADDAQERLAAAIAWAAEHGLALLHAPASMLAQDSQGQLARSLVLGARLAQAALAIDDDAGAPLAPARLQLLVGSAVPVLLLAPVTTTSTTTWATTLADWPHRRIEVGMPSCDQRLALWRDAARQQRLDLPEPALQALAQRHVLSGSRIRAALATVAAATWTHSGVEAPDLHAALDHEAAARANDVLARLATRVERTHHWQQLVLAENSTRQLREIADAIRVRDQVYRQWGMQQRTGRSAGLMMLFCGASGTGKTMAASVVSNAAELPLYRIDLASVVSKYIGETEQNLDRIFRAAERASAVLLFDEADALLGRRSEVKDAHDRYANLEVAYLLQKMEEHDGVVILSSNLPKNLDSAFARRMHYTVEFGRPSAPLRERLWRGMFPVGVPLAPDIDYAFLAERFETTGGEIQAIALDAAFLAAAQGGMLTMQHLMYAMSRRQTQQGNAGGMGRYREHHAQREAGHAATA